MVALVPLPQLIRWTIPRFRFDQLMSLAWKVMIPLALLNLVCVMVVKQFGWPLVVLHGARRCCCSSAPGCCRCGWRGTRDEPEAQGREAAAGHARGRDVRGLTRAAALRRRLG